MDKKKISLRQSTFPFLNNIISYFHCKDTNSYRQLPLFFEVSKNKRFVNSNFSFDKDDFV